jgi:hypothetical protein
VFVVWRALTAPSAVPDENPAKGSSPTSSHLTDPGAYPLPIKGGLTVDVKTDGTVRLAVTGLDVIGMEEQTPTLVKMSPEEARELAQTLMEAARQAEAE